MKLLATILMVSGLLASVSALACQPPPPGIPAITLQASGELAMITDDVVLNAIAAQGPNVMIRSVNLKSSVRVLLNNGCRFEVVRDDKDASPGTCPQLLPVKIVKMVGCTK